MITTAPPPSFSRAELDGIHPDHLTHAEFTEIQERMSDPEAWLLTFGERANLTHYEFCDTYLRIKNA